MRDHCAELGTCRRGEGAECETGDGGCRFEASEVVEEDRESCQGVTDKADVARVVEVADGQSDVMTPPAGRRTWPQGRPSGRQVGST